MKLLDLTQDFSMHTPAFASYTGPSIKWVKRLAFDKAGGQELTSTLHVGTHLDAPAHFYSGGKFIGDLPLDWLVGPACVVDLERMGLGDFDLYGPEHFERWEQDSGGAIDEVLDSRITFGCFPWRFQGGEAAFCRAVAFLDA